MHIVLTIIFLLYLLCCVCLAVYSILSHLSEGKAVSFTKLLLVFTFPFVVFNQKALDKFKELYEL